MNSDILKVHCTLRELQLALLEVLSDVINLCEENNLRYYAFGGTCLGAVRHSGFIPWDDDIDIAMPREDYNKLLSIAEEKLPPHYKVISGYTRSIFSLCIAKIHNLNNTRIGPAVIDIPEVYSGVSIDIMPLDGIMQDSKERNRYIKRLGRMELINSRLRFFTKAHGIKGVVLNPIMYCANKLVSQKAKMKYFEKCVATESRYPFDCSDMLMHSGFVSCRRNKVLIPRKCFEEWIYMDFESIKIRVPKEYDLYLRLYYGDDYMTPPPESEREYHEVALIDLDKPFSYYAELKRKGELK